MDLCKMQQSNNEENGEDPEENSEQETVPTPAEAINMMHKIQLTVPWKKLLTSLPFWAIVVASFGHGFGFFTLLTEMPTYLDTILHYDLGSNSFLSALPYLGMWISGTLCSIVADTLRERKILSTTAVRKIFSTIGLMGPCICLIIITFLGCNRGVNVAFLVLGVTLSGAVYSGHSGNYLDITPKHGGTVLAISNSIGVIPGMVGPYIVGTLTEGNETRERWSIVFYLIAVVYVISSIFYVIFASGEEVQWSKDLQIQTQEAVPQILTVESDEKKCITA